jgi:proline dehydrogenase
MTSKQKAAESREQREQLKRHEGERVELERSLLTSAATLKATADRKRRELDFHQLKETFQLRAKYGHEIGPGGQSILDGTYKRGRR